MNGLEILYCESPDFRAFAVDEAMDYMGTDSPEFAQEWLEHSFTPEAQREEFDWINTRGIVE